MKTEDFAAIGLIVGTFGNMGELKVKILSDSPELLNEVPQVVIEIEDRVIPIEIESTRIHKGLLILKIKTCNSITEGLQFKGGYLSINKKDRPVTEDDEYYVDQLIGLEVFTVTGRRLGKVQDVISVTSNDIIEVKDTESGKEYLIPFIGDIVKEINLTDGIMKISPMEGLLDDVKD